MALYNVILQGRAKNYKSICERARYPSISRTTSFVHQIKKVSKRKVSKRQVGFISSTLTNPKHCQLPIHGQAFQVFSTLKGGKIRSTLHQHRLNHKVWLMLYPFTQTWDWILGMCIFFWDSQGHTIGLDDDSLTSHH